MTINQDKVYLVYATDSPEYGESFVTNVMKTEEEAKKYVELQNQLSQDSCGYNYYYTEKLITTVDLNAHISDYYCYCADIEWESAKELRTSLWIPEADRLCLSDKELEDRYNHPDNTRYQDNELYKKIDKGELFVERTDTLIEVYSKNSFEEARNKCLEIWEKEIESLKEQ